MIARRVAAGIMTSVCATYMFANRRGDAYSELQRYRPLLPSFSLAATSDTRETLRSKELLLVAEGMRRKSFYIVTVDVYKASLFLNVEALTSQDLEGAHSLLLASRAHGKLCMCIA
jgi:hypothetical protein